MAFRMYNIQLLALDTAKDSDVGVEGYKKFLRAVDSNLTAAIKAKRLPSFAFTLGHDTLFSPFTIHVKKDYATGAFVKFHRAESVQDLYTNQELFSAKEGTTPVTNAYLFRFVFDYTNHRLAIEELGGRLPRPGRIAVALEHLMKEAAKDAFPKHQLTINLVSEEKKLRTVLAEADGFGRINVKLTFPNGSLGNDILDELRDNNVHQLEHTASPGRGAIMPAPTSYMKELMGHATKFGSTTFTYYKKLKNGAQEGLKRFSYASKDFPKLIRLRQGVDEKDDAFLDRVWSKLESSTKQ